MTHELLTDLRRESDRADIVVVDNRGDYRAAAGETVLRPGTNLGWAGGTNLGSGELRRSEHAGLLWLNNDTRLAAGFVAGLLRCWRETGAGLVGPFYDCHWAHQRLEPAVEVDRYRPRNGHFRAPFLDGTCIFVPVSTVDTIGLLDADTFSPVGWGAELDYSLRARAAGLELVVTRLSYLHHEKSVTATTAFAGGLEEYGRRGYPVMMEGLRHKWGEDWLTAAGLDPVNHQTSPPTRKARVRSRRA